MPERKRHAQENSPEQRGGITVTNVKAARQGPGEGQLQTGDHTDQAHCAERRGVGALVFLVNAFPNIVSQDDGAGNHVNHDEG